MEATTLYFPQGDLWMDDTLKVYPSLQLEIILKICLYIFLSKKFILGYFQLYLLLNKLFFLVIREIVLFFRNQNNLYFHLFSLNNHLIDLQYY
jgi:hypothetical protein